MITTILSPFDAYEGKDPYIFVSYSHKDSEPVFRDLKFLNDLGYRIWYDDGIVAATEWSSSIEKKLESCTLFLLYLSKQSRESENVKDEINYAIKQNKSFLYISFEDVKPPDGMGLRMHRIQGILKYQLSDNGYYKKLIRALPDILKEHDSAPFIQYDETNRQNDKTNESVSDDGNEISIGVVKKKIGGLEIHNEMDGVLWIDDKKICEVNAATIIPVENMRAGNHTIRILSPIGNFNQKVTIAHNETLKISSNINYYKNSHLEIEWIIIEGFGVPFFISSTPITFDQYDKYCDATRTQKPFDNNWGRGKRPVINVNVSDATAYCEWLSLETNTFVRLPEENEWEFAARGGNKSRGSDYSGSNILDDVAWHFGNSGIKTFPVGEKMPNELGIYDMTGNVFEWCGLSGVVRGGSWSELSEGCHIAFRQTKLPMDRDNETGFRIIQEM